MEFFLPVSVVAIRTKFTGLFPHVEFAEFRLDLLLVAFAADGVFVINDWADGSRTSRSVSLEKESTWALANSRTAVEAGLPGGWIAVAVPGLFLLLDPALFCRSRIPRGNIVSVGNVCNTRRKGMKRDALAMRRMMLVLVTIEASVGG